MRTPEFIQRCMAAGMPLDMALMAAKAFEAECELAVADVLETRRAKERARQAKHRSKDNECHAVSRDKTLDAVAGRDLTGAGAQVVTPSLPSLRSEEVAVVAGECAGERVSVDDWPTGKASDHADMLIATVASPWLDPSKSPDLITTRGRVAAWKRDGASWEFDVLPIVAGLVAKRRQRIGTWKFFDGAISQSIADNRAALQIPEAGTVVQLRATGPPRTIDEKSSASWDYAMKRIAEDG